MTSIKFSEKIRIQKKQEEVFDYTQDYQNRLSWDTFLQKAILIEGATEAGLGIKSYCEAKNGLGMVTEYVSFRRPKVVAINMTKGPYMFRSFLGSWNFHHMGEDQTEVIFLYSFSLRFPFYLFGWFIRWRLKTNVRHRLLDLKNCLEQTSDSIS
ncbi:MAG: SRPBCC family protein [Bacteroidota bacterium]